MLIVKCITKSQDKIPGHWTGDCGEQLHLWQSHVRRNQGITRLGKSVIVREAILQKILEFYEILS